ncbi:hypothetical protein VNI00_004575, partial [Paramarasmius palmivorus]
DRLFLKCFVLLLFVADAAHCVFIVVYLHDSVIEHFDDASFLVNTNWMFNAEPALSGMISGMVQAFFGWRVKVITGSWILFVVIQICSSAVFLMGIATAIACGIVKTFTDFYSIKAIVIIWLICTTVADIVITSALVFHLRKFRTGIRDTDSHIDRIIRLTVPTGMLTAICAMTDLLVFVTGSDGTHLIFNCILPKLYTNSFLSSLNSRSAPQIKDRDATKPSRIDISFLQFVVDAENTLSSSSRPVTGFGLDALGDAVDEGNNRRESSISV